MFFTKRNTWIALLLSVLVISLIGTIVVLKATSDSSSNITHSKTIAAGSYHTVAITENGKVIARGYNQHGQCNVEEWKDIVQVAAGEYHTVGLRSNGTVVATGDNSENQCDVTDWKNIKQIATSLNTTFGLKNDGTVIATSFDSFPDSKIKEIVNWTDIVYISAGINHIAGIKSDGTTVAVGENDEMQCYVDLWTNIVDIHCGDGITIAIQSDGNMICEGNDMKYVYSYFHEIEDLINVYTFDELLIGLRQDGTVVDYSLNHRHNFDFENRNWTNIVDISVGRYHAVGLRSDGTLAVAESSLTPYESFYTEPLMCDVNDIAGIRIPERIQKAVDPSPAEIVDGDYIITVVGDILEYTGSDDTLIIPKEIGGLPTRSLPTLFMRSRLKSITLPDTITFIREYTFCDTRNLKEINLPNSIKAIGKEAFSESGLETITLPSSVLVIGDSAFKDCFYLEEVHLNEGLQVIRSQAFENCPIENLTIPSTVTYIQGAICPNNRRLSTVTFLGECPSFSSYIFLEYQGTYFTSPSTSFKNLTIYYPSAHAASYKTMMEWFPDYEWIEF